MGIIADEMRGMDGSTELSPPGSSPPVGEPAKRGPGRPPGSGAKRPKGPGGKFVSARPVSPAPAPEVPATVKYAHLAGSTVKMLGPLYAGTALVGIEPPHVDAVAEWYGAFFDVVQHYFPALEDSPLIVFGVATLTTWGPTIYGVFLLRQMALAAEAKKPKPPAAPPSDGQPAKRPDPQPGGPVIGAGWERAKDLPAS